MLIFLLILLISLLFFCVLSNECDASEHKISTDFAQVYAPDKDLEYFKSVFDFSNVYVKSWLEIEKISLHDKIIVTDKTHAKYGKL